MFPFMQVRWLKWHDTNTLLNPSSRHNELQTDKVNEFSLFILSHAFAFMWILKSASKYFALTPTIFILVIAIHGKSAFIFFVHVYYLLAYNFWYFHFILYYCVIIIFCICSYLCSLSRTTKQWQYCVACINTIMYFYYYIHTITDASV